MGLDNGIYVKSNRRKVTRNMLPTGIKYCWDEEYDGEGPEILYWRKNWSLRNAVLESDAVIQSKDDEFEYEISTSKQVFELIKIIVSFMNKETWEESDTIWEYEEYLPILRQNVINLAIIASFMENNPDIYLVFYDSY